MTRDITLCCVPFKATEQDGQLIFLDNSGFAFCHNQFTLEWNGSGWDLVDIESNHDRIYVAHIAAAYKWVQQHYLPHFVNGTAKRITYQDEIIKDPIT